MAKPVNKYYQKIAETPDAKVELGEVNDDGVISAFKVSSSADGADPESHYFQMDKTGDALTKGRRGGTQFAGGGTFSIKHGAYVGEGIPGVYIDSQSGDLVLRSGGRIRILAEDIDIIASGSGDHGNVQIKAQEKVNIISKGGISMTATDNINLFASIGLFLEGANGAYLIGKDVELVDGATSFFVSAPGLGTIEEIKRAARSLI